MSYSVSFRLISPRPRGTVSKKRSDRLPYAAGRFLLWFTLFPLAGVEFPGVGGLVLVLDGDGHADVGKVLLQGDDVLVEQADAALAGAARHGVLVDIVLVV